MCACPAAKQSGHGPRHWQCDGGAGQVVCVCGGLLGGGSFGPSGVGTGGPRAGRPRGLLGRTRGDRPNEGNEKFFLLVVVLMLR